MVHAEPTEGQAYTCDATVVANGNDADVDVKCVDIKTGTPKQTPVLIEYVSAA